MDLHERLVAARVYAGFTTAAEAAEALGVKYPTYAGHENGGSGFRADTGAMYARRFKVRFEWLMRGAGPMVDKITEHRELVEIYDALPPALRETYFDVLRKLAAPYQPQEAQKPAGAAKTKPKS